MVQVKLYKDHSPIAMATKTIQKGGWLLWYVQTS